MKHTARRAYPVIAGGAGEENPPGVEPGLTVPVEPEAPREPTGEPKVQQDDPHGDRVFTAEDIEKARREEKSKVYSRLEETQRELAEIKAKEDERQRLAQEEEARLAEEAQKRAEEEMTAKELLQQKEQEWQQRFSKMEEEIAQRDAIMQKEQELQALEQYRQERLSDPEIADRIVPDLRDLVRGNSPEEIDAAISTMIAKSDSILQSTQQFAQAQRQQMQGVRPTSPSIGPVEENDTAQQRVTATDIANMPMQEYIKNRGKLRAAAMSKVREQGLYGR